MSQISLRGRTTPGLTVRGAFAPLVAALRVAWFPAGLIAAIAALYARSLRFGLIWDDPAWYLQGAGQPVWGLLTGTSTFQFYRPLAMLYTRAVMRPDGTINAPLAHALQVGAHVVATLAVVGVWRALGLQAWPARLAGLLFALHPYSYQAVAWQAAHQPIGVMLGLLALLSAQRYRLTGQRGLLATALATYLAGLLFHESAVTVMVGILWLGWREGRWRDWRRWPRWPLLFVAVTLVHLGAWLSVPRSDGITGEGLDGTVLAYVLQGAAYPVTALMARLPEAWAQQVAVALASAGVLAGLALLVHRRGCGRAALLAVLLMAAGLAPVWVGLSWDYVRVGSRLLYPAAVGIGALWGTAIAGGLGPANRLGVRAASGGLLLLALGTSLAEWHAFQRLYAIGTGHLAEMVATCEAHAGERLVFVNFPDRLALRRAPYPLGYWGLTLAPVAQDLAEYALASTGSRCQTISIASFIHGLEGREVSPYRVDMRGEDKGLEGILQAARGAERVFVSDYAADGTITLRDLGRMLPDDGRAPTALFDDAAALLDWELTEEAAPRLRLTWRPIGTRSPGDTVFVHLLTAQGQLARDADGDALGGLVPMEAWEEGWVIEEWRSLPLTALPEGDYGLTVGVYNRITGERYPARTREGNRVPGDEFALTTVSVGAAHASR